MNNAFTLTRKKKKYLVEYLCLIPRADVAPATFGRAQFQIKKKEKGKSKTPSAIRNGPVQDVASFPLISAEKIPTAK